MSTVLHHTVATQQKISGILFAFVAAIGFSAKAILVKLAYLDPVDAITLLALRMAFSVPIFIAVAIHAGNNKHNQSLTAKETLLVVVLGLLGFYLASFLDFLGLQYISAGLERLILFLYPTLVVIISAVLFKQRIGRVVIVALLMSYAGIILVYMHDVHVLQSNAITGVLLVFGSTFAYALYLVGAGNLITKIGATRFTAYVMTVACFACLMQFAVTHPFSDLILPTRVYALSITMALLSTVLPAFLLAAAMRRIGSMHTSLIGVIGPVSTIYMAYLFLAEALSWVQIIGSMLVLSGVLLISLRKSIKNA